MKARDGFVLRTIVDEYMIMPTGSNISRFDGTVVLNEVSAFIWEKLQQPVTREMLLETLLAEYDVTPAVAEKDLDALLQRLAEYGLLEA